MYLQNIMLNYLNESKFEIENNFKPLVVKKSDWEIEEKRMTRVYTFDKTKFLESFIVEIIKYNRESDVTIETRFKEKSVGIIIHAMSGKITDMEITASKEINKIKKDVMYYYAD